MDGYSVSTRVRACAVSSVELGARIIFDPGTGVFDMGLYVFQLQLMRLSRHSTALLG